MDSSKAQIFWGNRAPAPGATDAGSSSFMSMSQLSIFILVFTGCLVLLLIVFTVVRVRTRLLAHRRLQQRAADASANQRLPSVLEAVGGGQWQIPGSIRKGFQSEEIEEIGARVGFEEYLLQVKGGEDPKLECIVCLTDYKTGDPLRQLHSCGHTFHQACVDAWLKSHRSCPLCRTELECEKPEPGQALPPGAECGGEAEANSEPVQEPMSARHAGRNEARLDPLRDDLEQG